MTGWDGGHVQCTGGYRIGIIYSVQEGTRIVLRIRDISESCTMYRMLLYEDHAQCLWIGLVSSTVYGKVSGSCTGYNMVFGSCKTYRKGYCTVNKLLLGSCIV